MYVSTVKSTSLNYDVKCLFVKPDPSFPCLALAVPDITVEIIFSVTSEA